MPFILLYQWIPEPVPKALCWTFIHSFWQGLLAAIAAAVIISSTRKAKASLRYNLLVILFASFLLIAGVSFFLALSHFSGRTKNLTFYTTVNQRSAATIPLPESSSFQAFKKNTLTAQLIAFCNRYAGLAVLLWFIFFTFKCLQLAYGLHRIRQLRKLWVFPPGKDWIIMTEQLSRKLGIRKMPVLLESRLVHAPIVVGFLRSAILVPAGLFTNLPPEQVKAVLMHELAHIRRNDYLVNLLQSLAETVFFFNPAFLWISALIRREREACCDDMVLAHLPHKHTYLEALVSFQERSLTQAGAAMAFISRKNDLFRRINRMLTHENHRLNGAEKFLLVLGILATASVSFISKMEPPPVPVPQIISFSTPSSTGANSNSPFAGYVSDTLPRRKEAHSGIKKKKNYTDTIRKFPSASADSDKIYQLINGKSFVVSQFGWATHGDSTSIIFVDGKRMTPDEVNGTIRKASIRRIGATAGQDAQRKYGLSQPVLELWLKPVSGTDNIWLPASEEQKALSQEPDSIRVRQQHELQNRQAASLEWQQQKAEWKKQQALFEEQRKQFKKRSALFEEQARKFKGEYNYTVSLQQKTIL
ncbi:MAG: M48 family metalloprotease [Williamsia sp.]|nr:M48 family metalloprotease [Williamsia sp.]